MDHLSLQKLLMQSLYLQNYIAKNKTQFNVDFFIFCFLRLDKVTRLIAKLLRSLQFGREIELGEKEGLLVIQWSQRTQLPRFRELLLRSQKKFLFIKEVCLLLATESKQRA